MFTRCAVKVLRPFTALFSKSGQATSKQQETWIYADAADQRGLSVVGRLRYAHYLTSIGRAICFIICFGFILMSRPIFLGTVGKSAEKPRARLGQGASGINLPNLDEVRRVSPGAPRISPPVSAASASKIGPSAPAWPSMQEDNWPMALLDQRNRVGAEGEDLLSRNYNWSAPIVKLAGRAGMDVNLSLSLNSLIWTRSGANIHFDLDKGFPSAGFRLGFPELGATFYNPETEAYSTLVTMPSGQRYEFRRNPAYSPNIVYEEMGSTHMLLVVKTNPVNEFDTTWNLLLTDGTTYKFKTIVNSYKCIEVKDRNGNYISIAYTAFEQISAITDTLERVIDFNYDGSNRLTSITQSWSSGPHTYATFAYEDVTIQTNYPGLELVGAANGSTISALTRVDMADGKVYAFEYNTYGQVKTIRCFAPNTASGGNYPGDYTLLSSITYNLTADAGMAQSDCPRFSSRRDWAKDWNEGVIRIYAGDVATWGSVTWPDGTIYKEFFGATGWERGLTLQTETWSNGSRKKWTTATWVNENPNVTYWLNPRVVETNIYDESGNQRRTTIDYGDFGAVSDIREYDGPPNTATVLRHTHLEYLRGAAYTGNLNRRLTQLVTSESLYDGDGVLQSKVSYEYDLGGEYLVHPVAPDVPPIRHDTARYGAGFVQGRGNLNVIRRWDVSDPNDRDKSLASKVGYNTSGSVIFNRDPLNQQTSMSYGDAFSDEVNRNTQAYPTKITDADNYATTIQYNYDFGGETQRRDGKGATVVNTYDLIGRVERVTDQVSGGYTRYVYGANHLYVQSYETINDASTEFYRITVFDGDGRVRGIASDHPGSVGGYKAQKYEYDVMGRAARESNPTEINVNWEAAGDDGGWVWRSQSYDWQGRPTVSTNQDGTTRIMEYSSCGCAGGHRVEAKEEDVQTHYVERGRRKIRTTYDNLGRVSKEEQFRFLGSLFPENTVYRTTTYRYNARNQATSIRVYMGEPTDDGSCPSGTCQEATMGYDGYGRMSARHKPIDEQNTNYLYEYYENDRLKKVTDPRGVVTNYTYYGRPLVKDITYGGAAEVSTSAAVHYEYDGVGNRTLMRDGLGEARYYYYNNSSRMEYETRQFNEIGVTTRIDYQYNISGQLRNISINGSGVSLTYNYDKAGQMTGVTGGGYSGISTFISQVGYRAWGAAKTIGYGNGRVMNYGYNARLQASHMDMPGVISSDYTYYEDGRFKEIASVNPAGGSTQISVNHRYGYDELGRIDNLARAPYGSILEGGPGYAIAHAYNAFDNMESQGHTNGPLIGNTIHTYSTSWLNNRNQDAKIGPNGYDRAGNMKRYDNRTYVYNSVGKPVSLSDLSLSYGYDGDGLKVKENRTSPPEPNVPANLLNYTTYFVRSTVLEGRIVMELDGGGQRKWDYIYGVGGGLVAEHNPTGQEMPGHKFGPRDIPAQPQEASLPHIPSQPNKVLWYHVDPRLAMAWTTRTDGSLIRKNVERLYTTNEIQEFDLAGNRVDYEYISFMHALNQSVQLLAGLSFVSPYLGNAFNPGAGCLVDGVQTACNTALFMVNSGAASQIQVSDTLLGGPPHLNPFGSDVIFTSYLDGEVEYEKTDPETGDLIGYGYLPIFRTNIRLQAQSYDPNALTREAGLDAARKALERDDCKNYIKGQFGENPLKLLNTLADKGQFSPGDPDYAGFQIRPTDPATGMQGYSPAYTIGTGEDAKIYTDPGVDRKTPAGRTVFRAGFYLGTAKTFAARYNISNADAVALLFLHELSHATGRTYHAENVGKVNYKAEVKGQQQLNDEVYENCFKPLTRKR
jgi:YD repeat-containing protein